MTYKKTLPELFECLGCHLLYPMHRYGQKRCPACSHQHNMGKKLERQRAKRLAAKEKQS